MQWILNLVTSSFTLSVYRERARVDPNETKRLEVEKIAEVKKGRDPLQFHGGVVVVVVFKLNAGESHRGHLPEPERVNRTEQSHPFPLNPIFIPLLNCVCNFKLFPSLQIFNLLIVLLHNFI